MASIATPETVGLSSSRLARIKTAVGQHLSDDKIAGAVTLVARRGEIVHLESMGWQDRESETAMRTDSIFRIYSMTKPITCAAALMLFEEGAFRLNDPLWKYLPEFKDTRVYVSGEGDEMVTVPPQSLMTVGQLFTHTSGLSYHFTEYGYVDQLYRETKQVRARPLAEFAADAAKLPLAFHPGTKWRYSIAHDILARLVEVITNQSYDDYLQEVMFGPLGMKDTGFYVPEEKHDRFTTMYGTVSIDEVDTCARTPTSTRRSSRRSSATPSTAACRARRRWPGRSSPSTSSPASSSPARRCDPTASPTSSRRA